MHKLDDAELRDLGVIAWPALSADFEGADLLLGNGFSMNLTSVFDYKSLFARFLVRCCSSDQRVLRAFNTTNFEFILEDLGTAKRVNEAMSLPAAPIGGLADRVREGLIRAIEESHPRKDAIDWGRLKSVADQLDAFGDIFTLNYDALLYHIIMICKDRWVPGGRSSRYNDYFWNRISDEYLQFMDFQKIRPYKHVYYLHGALFLFKSTSDETLAQVDVKLRTNSASELLDAVAREIRSGTLPLFVSEGRPEEKQRAIARSDYLRFANDALEATRSKLVIYGAGLGEPDAHIAKAISRGTAQAAVAMYVFGKTGAQLEQEMHLMRSRLPGVHCEFFDSSTLFS